MRILLEFAREAMNSALAGYGLIALMTLVFPAMGSASRLWVVVPAMFIIQFLLKLIFSRDANGHLRSTR